MTDNSPHKDKKNDDLLKELLSVPRRNLETRVRLLEGQIKERKKLSDQILSILHTRRTRRRDQVRRMKYSVATGVGETQLRDASIAEQGLSISIIGEKLSRFDDIIKFQQRLQEAREELSEEKSRLALIDDDSPREQPQNGRNK